MLELITIAMRLSPQRPANLAGTLLSLDQLLASDFFVKTYKKLIDMLLRNFSDSFTFF